jgi:hypothetical protein
MAEKDDLKRKMLAALLATRPGNALSKGAKSVGNYLANRPMPTQPEIAPNALGGLLAYPRPATTYLTPDQEARFRQWMKAIGHTQEAGYAVDRSFNGENYDYRGYFQKYGPAVLGQGQHLTDEFKLPSHPTFSNESVYAAGPNRDYAGSWTGEVYTPSPLQFIRGKRRFLSR